MKVRKFFGLTSRSVLEQIRVELGDDAVIVANHPTAQGVEISALAGDAMDTLLCGVPSHFSAVARVRTPEREFEPAPRLADRDVIAPVAETALGNRLIDEFAAMRSLLEGQVAQLTWSDSARRKPLRTQLTQELLACGYSSALAREITTRLPDYCNAAQARQWLHGVIEKNVRCVAPDDDIVASGGVFALVGPTGVGKTTTTAKLAARCAVRHGSASLALLTTDSYRIGAQDQLRIYARILGVAVQTVNDATDLREALDALRAKHLVLIDTVGMGQRDARVAEHATLLCQPAIRRLLLLNASSQAETLEEVVTAYGTGMDARRDGCIVTKQDESARLGPVLDVIIRNRLAVNYVADGQRVPEDLQTADAIDLARRSLQPAPRAPSFRFRRDEFPPSPADLETAHA
jgi:flagellar biosynthesis protein FlhF